MKKLLNINNLKDHVFDGMSIMVGGFMVVGTPEFIVDELVNIGVKDLTLICNDAGLPGKGIAKLITNGQVKTLIASHIGLNPEAGQLMSAGKMECILIPQGTLAERIRAGGAGLGGILTPTGIGTIVEEGKQIINTNGKDFILELPLRADLAILEGTTVDEYGNVVYTKTTRNFNPVMATATDLVIVGAREIIKRIDPDNVMTPHIFVDYVIKEEL
ncbi:MAG: Butyrate--acetoacetate CoA-transferase subunit A [Candidatus Izimaplasma bacterium HR2]|nr:MAG: Butyrate--acetoacetate CoA-transferase subunit A [Candidatus Izimaplasma bacterium HR2]